MPFGPTMAISQLHFFFSLEQIKPIVLCLGACALDKCFWASVCSSCCCCLSLIFASLFFFCQTLFSPHDHYFQIVVGEDLLASPFHFWKYYVLAIVLTSRDLRQCQQKMCLQWPHIIWAHPASLIIKTWHSGHSFKSPISPLSFKISTNLSK